MPPLTAGAPPVAHALAPHALTHFTAAPLWLLVACSLVSSSPRRTPRSLLPFILFAALLSLTSLLETFRQQQRQHPHQQRHPPTLSEVSVRQVPVLPPVVASPSPSPIPSASPTPPPSPAPSPAAPVAATPAAQPQQPATPSTSQFNPTPDTSFGTSPALGDCAGGLQRMQAILLLELVFEFLFIFLRCFADREYMDAPPDSDIPRSIDVTMRGYIFVRAIYTIPVLILNTSIYWIGGGPNGTCLSSFSAVQVPFVHLIFYLLYCILHVVIGLYRIDAFDFKDSSISSSDMPPPPRYRGSSMGSPGMSAPPTRTSSSFQTYGRRRQRYEQNQTESSGFELPKFRVNCGCCALNF